MKIHSFLFYKKYKIHFPLQLLLVVRSKSSLHSNNFYYQHFSILLIHVHTEFGERLLFLELMNLIAFFCIGYCISPLRGWPE